LPCLNAMLGCRWVDGRDDALRWYTPEYKEKVARLVLSFTHDGVGFHPSALVVGGGDIPPTTYSIHYGCVRA